MNDEAKFELSLDAKAHASFGQWDRANREITRALHAERVKVWEAVIDKAEQAERDTADPIWILEWAKAKAQEAL